MKKVYFCTFSLKSFFIHNYCCPVIFLATGSAKRDLYAKPTASRFAAQLWVGKDEGAVPRRVGCSIRDVAKLSGKSVSTVQ